MRTSRSHQSIKPRCRVPLIEICANSTQIKLDLGACSPCSVGGTALHIQEGGCPKYKKTCKPIDPTPCGCPTACNVQQIVEEIPKRAVIYPLHEVDIDGYHVFVLDGKIHQLGVGRYKATVMRSDVFTAIVFDIEYSERANLRGIRIATGSPTTTGGC